MIYKIIALIVFLFGVLLSQELAKTTKGKLVILYNDGTWSYVENSNNSKIKNNISQQVFVTRTGAKYHLSQCRYLKSKIPISLGDAQTRGYTPCKVCNPFPLSTINSSYNQSTKNSQNQKSKMVGGRCQATTKKGAQCKRKSQSGRLYCWQHP